MDLRQSKRYQLSASVRFSWEQSDGRTAHREAYTRDISASGVFVLTTEQLRKGTVVQLEVMLPSLRGQKRAGACLQTVGHVVRSEPKGFAAVADIAFRMQISETASSRWSVGKGDESGKHEAAMASPSGVWSTGTRFLA